MGGGSGGRWEIVPHVEPFLQQQKGIGNVIYNLEGGEGGRRIIIVVTIIITCYYILFYGVLAEIVVC